MAILGDKIIKSEFEDVNKFDDDRFIKLRLRLMHNNKNPNGSNFEDDNIEKAKITLQNIPLLAHVIEDEDGNIDFGSHDMTIEVNKLKDDELKIIYKELPIGIIPETNNYEFKEHKDKMYVYCDAYVYKDYSNYAQELVENGSEFKISMEIMVDDYEWMENDKNYVDITAYKYSGVTMLSNRFGTGMIDARAKKFSMDDSFEKIKNSFENMETVVDMGDLVCDYGIRFVNKDRMPFEFVQLENNDLESPEEKAETSELEAFKLKDSVDNKEIVTEEEIVVEEFETIETPEVEEIPEVDVKPEEFKVVEGNEEIEAVVEETNEILEEKSFSITAMQTMEALDNALDGEVIRDEEGNFVQETYYWAQDYDETFVYFTRNVWNIDGDRERDDMRATYSIEDAKATIDLEGAEVVFFVRMTKVEKDALEEERSTNMNALQSEFDLLKESNEELQTNYDNAMAKINDSDQEKRNNEENDLFSGYDNLLKDVTEYEDLKSKSSEYSIEDLEAKLALLYVRNKNVLKTNKKDDKSNLVGISYSNKEDKNVESPYGDIFKD